MHGRNEWEDLITEQYRKVRLWVRQQTIKILKQKTFTNEKALANKWLYKIRQKRIGIDFMHTLMRRRDEERRRRGRFRKQRLHAKTLEKKVPWHDGILFRWNWYMQENVHVSNMNNIILFNEWIVFDFKCVNDVYQSNIYRKV